MKDSKWRDPKLLSILKAKILDSMQSSGLSIEKIWKNFVVKTEDDPIDYPVSFVLVDFLGHQNIQHQQVAWGGTGRLIYPIDLIVAANRLHALEAFLALELYPVEDSFEHYHQLIVGAQKVKHNEAAALLLRHGQMRHADDFRVLH